MPSARNLPERLATHSPMCTARRTDWANAMIARKSNPSAMPSLTGGEMRATLETGSILANSATAQQWRSRLYMMMRTQGYQHEQPLGPKAWAAGAEQAQHGAVRKAGSHAVASKAAAGWRRRRQQPAGTAVQHVWAALSGSAAGMCSAHLERVQAAEEALAQGCANLHTQAYTHTCMGGQAGAHQKQTRQA